MKIVLTKTTSYRSEYTITRDDASVERFELETKTYFVHDICHYVVEKYLGNANGFWGMLSHGYSFNALFGKDNELTAELRFIEQIVGPVQSVYAGNTEKQHLNIFIQHLDFAVPEDVLDACLAEITAIIKDWEQLSVGGCLLLEWKTA